MDKIDDWGGLWADGLPEPDERLRGRIERSALTTLRAEARRLEEARPRPKNKKKPVEFPAGRRRRAIALDEDSP